MLWLQPARSRHGASPEPEGASSLRSLTDTGTSGAQVTGMSLTGRTGAGPLLIHVPFLFLLACTCRWLRVLRACVCGVDRRVGLESRRFGVG